MRVDETEESHHSMVHLSRLQLHDQKTQQQKIGLVTWNRGDDIFVMNYFWRSNTKLKNKS
jgi:hypothetical protein